MGREVGSIWEEMGYMKGYDQNISHENILNEKHKIQWMEFEHIQNRLPRAWTSISLPCNGYFWLSTCYVTLFLWKCEQKSTHLRKGIGDRSKKGCCQSPN